MLTGHPKGWTSFTSGLKINVHQPHGGVFPAIWLINLLKISMFPGAWLCPNREVPAGQPGTQKTIRVWRRLALGKPVTPQLLLRRVLKGTPSCGGWKSHVLNNHCQNWCVVSIPSVVCVVFSLLSKPHFPCRFVELNLPLCVAHTWSSRNRSTPLKWTKPPNRLRKFWTSLGLCGSIPKHCEATGHKPRKLMASWVFSPGWMLTGKLPSLGSVKLQPPLK